MKTHQRLALQRALAQEAIGKLRAVGDLFGLEDLPLGENQDRKDWDEMIAQFENWLSKESPLR